MDYGYALQTSLPDTHRPTFVVEYEARPVQRRVDEMKPHDVRPRHVDDRLPRPPATHAPTRVHRRLADDQVLAAGAAGVLRHRAVPARLRRRREEVDQRQVDGLVRLDANRPRAVGEPEGRGERGAARDGSLARGQKHRAAGRARLVDGYFDWKTMARCRVQYVGQRLSASPWSQFREALTPDCMACTCRLAWAKDAVISQKVHDSQVTPGSLSCVMKLATYGLSQGKKQIPSYYYIQLKTLALSFCKITL